MIALLLKGGKRRREGEVWTTPKGKRMTKRNGKIVPVKKTKNTVKPKTKTSYNHHSGDRTHRYVRLQHHPLYDTKHKAVSEGVDKTQYFNKRPTNFVNYDKNGITATNGKILIHAAMPKGMPVEHHGLKYPHKYKGDMTDKEYHTSDIQNFPKYESVIPDPKHLAEQEFYSNADILFGTKQAIEDWKRSGKETKLPHFHVGGANNMKVLDARDVQKVAKALKKLGHKNLHVHIYHSGPTGDRPLLLAGGQITRYPEGMDDFGLVMPIKMA